MKFSSSNERESPAFRPNQLHRLHLIDSTTSKREWRYWRRQGLALLSLTVGGLLSIPTVPGPGFVFVLLGIILADFPFKHRLVDRLRNKHWFRRSRVYLRRRWNLLIMLGEPWHDEVLHPEFSGQT